MVKSDNDYWNKFYEAVNDGDMVIPSLFAQYVLPYLSEDETLLELGCGNGRDSLFFAANGINVTAIDMSEIAVNELLNKQIENKFRVRCDDFICSKYLTEKSYDAIYSRFTLHTVDEEHEDILLKNVYHALNNGGRFFIEVRSVKDDIFGLGENVGRNAYKYNNHYRRFIVLDELITKLTQLGFNVPYAEEKRGFAPFKSDDPIIIRVVAEKILNQME